MNQENKTGTSQAKFLKLLKKNIKRAIAEKGINGMTRKGDKELDLLVKKMVKQPIKNKEEVSQIGEHLATEIIELSRKKGKTNLDKSVIRHIATQSQISFVSTVSPTQKQPTPSPTVIPTAESAVERPQEETPITPSPTVTPTAESPVERPLKTEPITQLSQQTSSNSDENPATEEEEELIPS